MLLQARPPPGPPPGASAWHAPLPQNFPPQMGGWNHQGWAMNQGKSADGTLLAVMRKSQVSSPCSKPCYEMSLGECEAL